MDCRMYGEITLQDQTRSEESGQGVIIQSRDLTTRDPRDSTAGFRVGGG